MSYLRVTLQRSHSHTLTRNCCWLGSLHTIDVSCDVTIWVAIFLMRLETTTDNLQKTRGIHHLNGDVLGVTSSPEVNCLFLVFMSCPPALGQPWTVMPTCTRTALECYLLCRVTPVIQEGNPYPIPRGVLESVQFVFCINSRCYIKILNHTMTWNRRCTAMEKAADGGQL